MVVFLVVAVVAIGLVAGTALVKTGTDFVNVAFEPTQVLRNGPKKKSPTPTPIVFPTRSITQPPILATPIIPPNCRPCPEELNCPLLDKGVMVVCE